MCCVFSAHSRKSYEVQTFASTSRSDAPKHSPFVIVVVIKQLGGSISFVDCRIYFSFQNRAIVYEVSFLVSVDHSRWRVRKELEG